MLVHGDFAKLDNRRISSLSDIAFLYLAPFLLTNDQRKVERCKNTDCLQSSVEHVRLTYLRQRNIPDLNGCQVLVLLIHLWRLLDKRRRALIFMRCQSMLATAPTPAGVQDNMLDPLSCSSRLEHSASSVQGFFHSIAGMLMLQAFLLIFWSLAQSRPSRFFQAPSALSLLTGSSWRSTAR